METIKERVTGFECACLIGWVALGELKVFGRENLSVHREREASGAKLVCTVEDFELEISSKQTSFIDAHYLTCSLSADMGQFQSYLQKVTNELYYSKRVSWP